MAAKKGSGEEKRPSPSEVFKVKAKAAFIATIAAGYSATKACQAADIARKTAYSWRDTDPEFADAWDDAIRAGNDVLEDEAFRRAVEGVQRPVFGKLGKIGEITEYSDGLMKFLMQGRNRKKFGNKTTIELTGANGGPVRAAQAVAEAASATEASALYREVMHSVTGEDDE